LFSHTDAGYEDQLYSGVSQGPEETSTYFFDGRCSVLFCSQTPTQVMSISSSGVPQKLDEKLELVKFSSIAWTHDNKGFFYNRCDFPGAASWSLVKIC